MKTMARVILVGGLAFLLASSVALASGFSIYEQSAKASGQAGAWVARADDAAANWYNPAALVWLESSEFQIGTNLITAGSDTELTSSDPNFGLFTEQTFETESSIETPSHLYFVHKVNDGLAWGIGLTTPFGLVTEWSDRPVTFSAQRSDLATFVLNPNVAFRLNESWSLAVGLDYIYADISEFSREIPIDLDGNPFNGFEVIGGSNLTGDGDDLGWNVALSYKSPDYAFGFTYRSDLTPEIEGDIRFASFGPLEPFFRDSPGTADLKLPDQAAVAFAWTGSPTWTFEVDVAYAGWSSFDTLDIDVENEVPGFVQDISLLEDWDDTFSYRFGAAYRASQQHEWRFGAVYDESPVPPETLRPSIPDSDRTGLTVGYGFTGASWSFDAYYMPLWFDDITAVSGQEGVIAGTYDTFVNLAGVTLSWRF